ncbi:MAG TPA: ABC-F family ATP-binding cassette domain-containing protein [Gemmatimonadales bacterium]|nr:ABC-F family ATP-binding cassette domain-containing protein [Gemmatimonadales bacterium]
MTLLSFSEVAVEFGATTLFRGVTFTVAAGERWGIVGRNGAGKTTIFRLITGEMQPTRGLVSRPSNLRLSLLDQHRDFGAAATVWEAAAHAYAPLLALEQSIARQAERLAELGEKVTEADLERFGRDQERFMHEGGYEFHARVDAVLQGLGFDAEESKTRALEGLSGGERGRVGLAAQLVAPADVVLLDEPTNHLDLETTEWIKQYLHEFGETVLVISHDRAFLDDTVDHVLHVANRTAVGYRGGYSAFVMQRAERELTMARQAEQQRKQIAKEEDFIRRNIAGRNSAQAKGRRAKLERLPRLSPPPGEAGAMSLRLETDVRSGDQVAIARKLVVKVADRTLLHDANVIARRGDVIALVGPNGAGKSTLLATLLGERAPAAGLAELGGSVLPAWFRQDLAQVPLDKRIYDCIADLRPEWPRGAIQNHLGAFGFSGDEVLRNTTVLSGGERARVALALITLARANLLILDEPTNHLDVESIEALEDAIDEYEGTVILVSHDRAFLRELSTRVWAFDGQRLEDYDGPFVEWEVMAAERAKRRASQAAEAQQAFRQAEREKARKTAGKDEGAEEAKRRQKREAEALERAVQTAESKVAELEAKLADESLYDGSADGARRAGALNKELEAARRELDQLMEKWVG